MGLMRQIAVVLRLVGDMTCKVQELETRALRKPAKSPEGTPNPTQTPSINVLIHGIGFRGVHHNIPVIRSPA